MLAAEGGAELLVTEDDQLVLEAYGGGGEGGATAGNLLHYTADGGGQQEGDEDSHLLGLVTAPHQPTQQLSSDLSGERKYDIHYTGCGESSLTEF